MTKEELIAKLAECQADNDLEVAHLYADAALIEYINDPEIAEAWEAVGKWYA
jgi:hypothetical protein